MGRSVEADLNRAKALAKGGKLAEAAALYRGVLGRFPANARARDGLAALGPVGDPAGGVRGLLKAGRAEDALLRLEPLIVAAPRDADLRHLAATALARLGFHARALAQYRVALEAAPGMVAARFGEGNMLYLLGQFAEAAEVFRVVLAAEPAHADAQNNLGLALHRAGDLAGAAAVFAAAVGAAPQEARLWFNLANAEADRGRSDAAIDGYRRALSLAPEAAEVANNLGNVLRGTGDLEGAMAAYRQSLRHRPDNAACHCNLADLHRFQPQEPWIADLASRLAAATSDADRVHFGFALAKALDDTGDRAGAFAAWEQANRRRKAQLGYDIAEDRRQFAALRRMFGAALPATAGDPAFEGGPRLIFIVGMMRSGTSLVEKILASHSRVFGAGELEFMARAALPSARRAEADEGQRIDRETALAVRQGYLAALDGLPDRAEVITDKMPSNATWVGHILTAFPDARVIHMQRDPVAVGWSNFRHYFSQDGNGHAFDLTDIGTYTRMQDDLMAFWKARFPGRIRTQNYEALTEDQEGQTRALLDWCGLEFEVACLDFHRTPGLVRTASAAQVRRAMYRGSSEEWRRYEAFLGPLKAALAGEGG